MGAQELHTSWQDRGIQDEPLGTLSSGVKFGREAGFHCGMKEKEVEVRQTS